VVIGRGFSQMHADFSFWRRFLLSFKHTDVPELIIKAFYRFHNVLGYGFLEKVYRNALAIELRKLGLEVISEARIIIYSQNLRYLRPF
jgi:hypothetical protein